MIKALFSLILTCLVSTIYSQDATTIYKNTVSSTVTIETDIGQGSGFFVGENMIVTNYHVIEGATNAFCFNSFSSIKYPIEGYVAFDKSVDLVLLKVVGLNKGSIKISKDIAVPGQKVYVIGTPIGLEATISDGIVSGLRNFEQHKLIQITAPISPGSSGGPVLNEKGEVIGVSVGQLTDGQNLNFAIPIENVENLKMKLLEVKPIGEVFKTYKTTSFEWMAENLNISHFRNGDIIPEAKTDEEWQKASETGSPAWCYYEDEAENGEKWGKLYNWYAVNDARGLAPKGWHIPSDDEWTRLINHLNLYDSVDTELKRKSGYAAPQYGGRTTGMGYTSFIGTAYWWSSSKHNNHSAGAVISQNLSNYYPSSFFAFFGDGHYVRCVRN